MAKTLFSIIITSYNQRDFIRDSVESALSQHHSCREVIVVDDGSTDGSLAILEGYGNAIQLVKHERNQGMCEARNDGASKAVGEYLVFLDGDDILKPWALTVYGRIVDACRPKVILGLLSMFQGTPPVFDQKLPREIEIVRYDNLVEKDRSVGSGGTFLVIEYQTFREVDGWNRDSGLMENYDLAARLAFSGRAVQILAPSLILYRIHTTNTSHNIRGLITGCLKLLAADRSNKYSVARRRRFVPCPLIGGPALMVVRRALRAGLYADGLKLLTRVWPWIAITALARLRGRVVGRRPAETLAL
jgi:glycosyltransferase involved in cell wall biosynthesis